MKTLILASLLLAINQAAFSQEGKYEQKPKIERENIEWCDVWIPGATNTNKPRVLLVGDSITKGYYKVASDQLGEKATCARFATSACIADPAFHVQLEALLSQYTFALIHFNNGLHGVGYTEEEYQAGYKKALKSIQKHSPSTKLVLALSTPLNETSQANGLNPRITERNRIVSELAKTYGAAVNDLHSISKGHPEYYTDAYHYKAVAIELQGKQVAEIIKAQLK
ncbi:MAG: SGNH/GDSL hydrolase family protein [bacterium]